VGSSHFKVCLTITAVDVQLKLKTIRVDNQQPKKLEKRDNRSCCSSVVLSTHAAVRRRDTVDFSFVFSFEPVCSPPALTVEHCSKFTSLLPSKNEQAHGVVQQSSIHPSIHQSPSSKKQQQTSTHASTSSKADSNNTVNNRKSTANSQHMMCEFSQIKAKVPLRRGCCRCCVAASLLCCRLLLLLLLLSCVVPHITQIPDSATRLLFSFLFHSVIS